jgi:rhodanese-related sulfurtransferase
MRDLTKALFLLYPTAVWTLNSDDYSGLTWLSEDISKPTEAELFAECDRLQAEYIANAYKYKRAAAYPSFADQFDLLYHGGMDAWKAAIDAVKQEYPKP